VTSSQLAYNIDKEEPSPSLNLGTRCLYICVWARNAEEGEGDMIHPWRWETNQLCSDRGTIDVCVCVCYLTVAFTSCDTITADYNNIDDIGKQNKAEYNKRYRLKRKAKLEKSEHDFIDSKRKQSEYNRQ